MLSDDSDGSDPAAVFSSPLSRGALVFVSGIRVATDRIHTGNGSQQMHLPTWHGARERARGFSLVELMAAIAVLAILGAIAAPSLESLINSNRLANSSNELVALLNTARVEGARGNARVVVCASDDGGSCGADASPKQGILVTRKSNSAGAGLPEPIAYYEGESPVSILPGPLVGKGLHFGMDGMPPSHDRPWVNEVVLRACIPTRRPANNIRDLVLMPAGRVKVVHSDGGGQCPAIDTAVN